MADKPCNETILFDVPHEACFTAKCDKSKGHEGPHEGPMDQKGETSTKCCHCKVVTKSEVSARVIWPDKE